MEIKMLNIKHIAADLKSPILILRGKLMKDEAVELKRACEQYLKEKKKLTLNLGEITFIDIYGIKALRELIRQEVKLSNCSFYIFTMVETLNGC